MQYTYKILLHKEPEGGYTVTVPVLPGCITCGENVDEAIAMAKKKYDRDLFRGVTEPRRTNSG